MIAPETTALLNRLVDGEDDRAKARVLHVVKDFLESENGRIERADKGTITRHTTDCNHSPRTIGVGGIPKELTLGVLLGNTKEFAELRYVGRKQTREDISLMHSNSCSVNGTVAQRYVKRAHQCALQASTSLGRAGFAVIKVILEQGLAHPLLVRQTAILCTNFDSHNHQCITPVIVAETGPDISHRNTAHALHKLAHDKYGRHIYSNLSESIQETYHFHQRLASGPDVPGCDIHGDAKLNAVLGLPYSLIKQNDMAKRKFLQALLKPFHLSIDEAEQDMVC